MKHNHHRENAGVGTGAAVLIIIAIFVIAYFAVPAFQAWISNLWGQLKNIANSNFGFSGVIVFTDGTQQTFGNTGLAPMTIEMGDPAKPVASITVNVNAQPSFYGDLTSYSVSGSLTYGYVYFGAGAPVVKLTDTISTSGTAWVTGTSKTLITKTYTAAQLETGMPTEGDKAYILEWAAAITFTCTINGASASKASNAVLDLSALHSTPQLNAVSLTVTNSILYV